MGKSTDARGAGFPQTRQLARTWNAITAAATAALRLSARPGHRDFDERVALLLIGGRQPLLLIADQQEAGRAIVRLQIVLRRLEAGADELARARAKPREKFVPRRRATACVKIAPMDARTASTEKGSAQSSIRIRPPAPTASPVRRIVPILPGSRRPGRRATAEPNGRSLQATCPAAGRRRAASADCPCRTFWRGCRALSRSLRRRRPRSRR